MDLIELNVDVPNADARTIIRETLVSVSDYLKRSVPSNTTMPSVVFRIRGDELQVNRCLNCVASLTGMPILGFELHRGVRGAHPVTIDDLETDYGPARGIYVFHLRGFLR